MSGDVVGEVALGSNHEGQACGHTDQLGSGQLAKIAVGKQVALRAHLRLVEMAKRLAPYALKSTTHTEVVEAIQELQAQGNVKQWPPELQQSLWRKAVEAKLQRVCTEQNEAELVAVMTIMRPYALEKEVLAKNLLQPALCWLDLSEADKVNEFQSVMLECLLVPCIQRGQGGQAHLKWLLERLSNIIGQHLEEEELCEAFVLSTTSFLAAFNAMEGILQPDIFRKTAFRDFVIEFSRVRAVKDVSPFGLLAAMFRDVEHYDNMLKDTLEDLLAVEVHLPMLTKCQQLLKDEGLVSKSSKEQSEVLLQLIKDMALLNTDMPTGSMEQHQKELSAMLVRCWEKAAVGLGTDKTLDLKALDAWLSEASLTFPLLSVFSEARSTLAGFLVQQAGEDHMQTFLLACTSFMANIEDEDVVGYAELVEEKAANASGVAIPEAKEKEFADLAQKLSEHVEKKLDGSLSDWEAERRCFCALRPWLEKSLQTQVDIMTSFVAAAEAVGSFHGEHPDIKSMLVEDNDKKKLASVMRTSEALAVLMQKQSEGHWGSQSCSACLEGAKETIAKAKQQDLGAARQDLIEATALCDVTMRVGPQKKQWDSDISDRCDWQELAKLAKNTVLTLDNKVLADATQCLTQVCPQAPLHENKQEKADGTCWESLSPEMAPPKKGEAEL